MSECLHQTVMLSYEEQNDRERAAQFIAQLVREGVHFKATHINNERGCEVIYIEFTGGY